MTSPLIKTFGEELAMELLTMLSPWPARLLPLSQDMVVEQSEIHDLVRILRRLNFKIIVARHEGYQCVWIADAGWKAAEAAATGYLNRVERISDGWKN